MQVYYMTGAFSVMGYLSIVFVLLLIKLFNASVAEAVKSVRKVTTIIISFVAFSKPVSGMHALGFLLFVGSVLLGLKQKLTTKAQTNAKPSPELRKQTQESLELLGEPEPLDIGSSTNTDALRSGSVAV